LPGFNREVIICAHMTSAFRRWRKARAWGFMVAGWALGVRILRPGRAYGARPPGIVMV
jgi:hypothetical protein